MDACEIEAEILEVKSWAGVVVVRSFVPEWKMITGLWPDLSISTSLRIVFTSSILEHLKYKNSCVGWKSFLVSIYFQFESQKKTTVGYSRGSNWLAWERDIICFVSPGMMSVLCSMPISDRLMEGVSVSQSWRSENLFPVGMFGATVMLVSILGVSWVLDFVPLSSVVSMELAFVPSISGVSSWKQRVLRYIERVAILLQINECW